MVKVTWTDQALEDLEAICLFIARDSPHYAKIFANRAFESTDRLERFPFSSRIVPEIDKPDIREIIMCNYRIIYRVLPKEVEILTVHHGAKLLESSNIE